MNVTVLGSGAACPRPGGACAGYLIRGGGADVMIDAGNGTVSNVLRHVPAEHLEAVVISHKHADHISDLLPLMFALAIPHERRVPLWVAPGVIDAIYHLGGGEPLRRFMDQAFEVHDIDGPITVRGLEIMPFPTVHPVPTFGFRVTDGDRTVVYTADTAPHDELPGNCAGADLLIAEATILSTGQMPPGMHMNALETGELAAKAGARQLALTHIWMDVDPQDAVDEAASVYSGPIRAAREGETYALI